MKTNSSDPKSIFRDRRLTEPGSPQPLLAQEPDDLIEAVIRVLLVLCILVSPFLCGIQAAGPAAAAAPAVTDAGAFAPARTGTPAHLPFVNASLRLR
jgi:hypothetical protein